MLRQGYSVSMYMFHGGTSFGWMNGANSNGTNYEPDTTSYDYDAPLNESGQPTPKYMAFRDAIARVTGKTPPPIPAVTGRHLSDRSPRRVRFAVEQPAQACRVRQTSHDGRS